MGVPFFLGRLIGNSDAVMESRPERTVHKMLCRRGVNNLWSRGTATPGSVIPEASAPSTAAHDGSPISVVVRTAMLMTQVIRGYRHAACQLTFRTNHGSPGRPLPTTTRSQSPPPRASLRRDTRPAVLEPSPFALMG